MKQPIDLSIIILHYNTLKLTRACLQSLDVSTDSLRKEVILVNNASTDDSFSILKKEFPHCFFVDNSQNLGFAKANNQAAQLARGNYLLLLNSDTELKPSTLGQLWARAVRHKADIASCQLLNPNGTLQPQGGYLPNLVTIAVWILGLDDLPWLNQILPSYQVRNPNYFNVDHQVGWLGGTAMLIKNQVYKKLNGFDEKLFMYAEDVDLCQRAHDCNYSRWYFCTPSLIHLGQGSGVNAASIIGEFKGISYFVTKHKSPLQRIIVSWLLKTGAFLRFLVFAMMGQHEKQQLYRQLISLKLD